MDSQAQAVKHVSTLGTARLGQVDHLIFIREVVRVPMSEAYRRRGSAQPSSPRVRDELCGTAQEKNTLKRAETDAHIACMMPYLVSIARSSLQELSHQYSAFDCFTKVHLHAVMDNAPNQGVGPERFQRLVAFSMQAVVLSSWLALPIMSLRQISTSASIMVETVETI